MNRKLQVFVSSTYKDLHDERQAAVEGILQANHIPAGMELFAAGDQSQLEVIKRWIAGSDVLLLLLGGRYGSIEPGSGLSYVEVEYSYAQSIGIPAVGVVLRPQAIRRKVELNPDFGEIEHQDALEQFRSRVLTKLCTEADDAKDVKNAVLRALREQEKNESLIGWVRRDQARADPQLVAELTRLSGENAVLRDEVDRLASSLKPAENDVDKLIQLLTGFGMPIYDHQKKALGQWVAFTGWLLAIGEQLGKWPHKIMASPGTVGAAAPHLAAYGLMAREEEEIELKALGSKMKHTYFVFTDIGSKVYAELKRRQLRSG